MKKKASVKSMSNLSLHALPSLYKITRYCQGFLQIKGQRNSTLRRPFVNQPTRTTVNEARKFAVPPVTVCKERMLSERLISCKETPAAKATTVLPFTETALDPVGETVPDVAYTVPVVLSSVITISSVVVLGSTEADQVKKYVPAVLIVTVPEASLKSVPIVRRLVKGIALPVATEVSVCVF